MQKNKELQELFNNYKNLSEEQLDRLLGLILKQEKEKLGLNLPIQLNINYDELGNKYAGGDSSLDYNNEKNRYEHTVRLNGNEWYKQYLANRNKTLKQGNMVFESSLDSLYNLIARLCHEIRHSYQDEVTLVNTDITDPNALTWLKQVLVIKDEEFYRNSINYQNMPREVDAFNYQYTEALEYIKNYTNIEIENPEFFNTLQETLNRNQKENVKPMEDLFFEVDGRKVKVNDYLNENIEEALANNSSITPSVIKSSILRYEFNSDGTKKSYEQLIKDKQERIDNLDQKSPDYQQQIKHIEEIYNSIITNDRNLQLQATMQKQQGYTREENGNKYIEKQYQVLLDSSKKEIGNRTITWNTDIEKGTEKIDTIGTFINEDGKYEIKDKQEVLGGELQLQRKELKRFNKLTGKNEQYVYQKDKNGNEMYYKIEDNKLTFKVTKNSRRTSIEQYDKDQLTDVFEYDKDGEALIGIEGIDRLNENYVEKLFDSQIPYIEAENRDIQPSPQVNTQKLGKETIDINKNVIKIDSVEKQINNQMMEQNRKQAQNQNNFRDTYEYEQGN